MSLRPITEGEWREYEWHEITALGDADRIYVRGRRLTDPPRGDGFVYVEALGRLGDAEQRWQRAMTPAGLDGIA